jgi:hypothetical protein
VLGGVIEQLAHGNEWHRDDLLGAMGGALRGRRIRDESF